MGGNASTQPFANPSRRRLARRGLSLVEMVICIVIIAFFVVPMVERVANHTAAFAESRANIDGHWIAHAIMNTLVSEELPDFTKQGANLRGEGNVSDFLANTLKVREDDFSPSQWRAFDEWTYAYTKTIVVYQYDEVQKTVKTYSTLGDGSAPDFGQNDLTRDLGRATDPAESTPEQRMTSPSSRTILIKLQVMAPGAEYEPYEDVADDLKGRYTENDLRTTQAGRPGVIEIITEVDADDFKADVPDAEPTAPAAPNQPNQPNPPDPGNPG